MKIAGSEFDNLLMYVLNVLQKIWWHLLTAGTAIQCLCW
jgi:hypothetical protein